MAQAHAAARYDFANLLFAGPCNQRCPSCIGRQLDPRLNRSNLDAYPPRGVRRLARLMARHGVRQLVFTGTNTDPQLYRHQARLIRWFRRTLPGVQISLHTNGQLAAESAVLNAYDRATISFPTFDAQTFARMTGAPHMPDLEAILRAARIPIKVSCLVTEENAAQVPDLLARCRGMGLQRVVLRRPVGPFAGPDPIRVLSAIPGIRPTGSYRGNPVYAYYEVEVTCWDFCRSTCAALNLFSDGTITPRYLLARSGPNSRHFYTARQQEGI